MVTMDRDFLLGTYAGKTELDARSAYAWAHYNKEAHYITLQRAGHGGAYRTGRERLIPRTTGNGQDTGYLYRRGQGESDAEFKERVRVSRFPMHMNRLIGGFAGSIEILRDQISRTWAVDDQAPPFGDTSEGLASEVWQNADCEGEAMETLLFRSRLSLMLDHEAWLMVEPLTADRARARVCAVELEDVLNYRPLRGPLREVVLREDAPEGTQRIAHYHPAGVDRYDISGKGKNRDLNHLPEMSSTYEVPYYAGADRSEATIPIFRERMSLAYHVGFAVAQDANYLYNLLSDARMGFRKANHPFLRGREMSKSEFDTTKKSIAAGANVLMGDWDFIAASSDRPRATYEVYKEEAEDFYISAFDQYNNAARQSTATEIMQNESRGRFAFLSSLARSQQDIENRAWFYLAQTWRPEAPELWNAIQVNYPAQFAVKTERERAELFALWRDVFDVETALRLSGFGSSEAAALAESYAENVTTEPL